MKRLRVTRHFVIGIVIASLVACGKRSSTRPAPAARASPTAPLQRSRYQFSSAGDSSLRLEFPSRGEGATAQFKSFTGFVEATALDAKSLSLSFDVANDSLESADAKIARHAKSPAGLNSARFPSAHFASTSVALGGALGATNTIQGHLRLCETTLAVALPVTVHIRPHDVDIEGEFPLDPKEFGCTRALGTLDPLPAPWTVSLSIHAEK
jgi:polyisoprenoid-binding protein YceI